MIPLSKQNFSDFYTKYCTKLQETTETLFSGIDLSDKLEENYIAFMESPFSNMYYAESSLYEQNKVIQKFIDSEVLSPIYTDTYNQIITESGEVSFRENYIFENTLSAFPSIKYLGEPLTPELIEEGFGSFWAAAGAYTAGAALGLASIPATVFGAITFLGMELLFPSRLAKQVDDLTEFCLGSIARTLTSTQSFMSMGSGGIANTNRNILNFDNIDLNPDVKALFSKLSKQQAPKQGFMSKFSFSPKSSIDGIDSIVASCLEHNNVIEGMDIDPNQRGFLLGKYTPRYNSIFTVFYNNVFRKSGDSGSPQYGTLLSYRKCLTEKLVDIYKFLMIANISQNKDYRKILKVMKRGFENNPEQLLAFVTTDSDEEKLNKENIITLLKFRFFLTDMAVQLGKGAFQVDRESGTFLTQKLKMVDQEIEDYMARNQKQIETVFENRREFANKNYKYNPIPERDMKRKLFGLNDQIK